MKPAQPRAGATPGDRSLTFRPIELHRDGDVAIAFARDLIVASFGTDAKFVRDFGEDGADYLAWLADRLAEDPDSAALLLKEGTPVGMVVVGTYEDDASIGYVYHYYLVASERLQGLGTALDDYAMETLRRRGLRRARLSVAETNAPAVRFYIKRGWAHAGPRPGQPGVAYMDRAIIG
jgi:GNAT superfamily N-acetyltransferase